MEIREATIHQLEKSVLTTDEGSVTPHYRTAPLTIDDTLRVVSADLLGMYATRQNSTGTFGANPTLHQFPVQLERYVSSASDLSSFSKETLTLVQTELEQSVFANGGYALFLRYDQGGSEYLLIAMLKLKPGAGINEVTLDLEPTLNIDTNLLHEAARINLTRLAVNEQPYLTFIRGKAKAGDVTAYFRKALACVNFTSAKHHTEQFIQAAQDFVEAREDLLTVEDKRDEMIRMRARLFDCFAASGKEAVLQTLAGAVMPGDPQNFIDFVKDLEASEKYSLSDRFEPDKRTFNRLKRIQGKIGKTISLSFAVDDVQQSRVVYDASNDWIILKSPSGDLAKEIQDNVLQA